MYSKNCNIVFRGGKKAYENRFQEYIELEHVIYQILRILFSCDMTRAKM